MAFPDLGLPATRTDKVASNPSTFNSLVSEVMDAVSLQLVSKAMNAIKHTQVLVLIEPLAFEQRKHCVL
jgi:hypothetical protein